MSRQPDPRLPEGLRALIEEFQNHCRFILTCNYPHNIIDAIHSRCTVFDFHLRDPKEQKALSAAFFSRLVGILKENKVEFNVDVVGKFVLSKAPDWRGILNTIQGNISAGKLNDSILGESLRAAVVEYIKTKKWGEVRDWMFAHTYLHPKR